MFKLSSIVTYLSYIHKTSSVWSVPVKVVLDLTRICCSVVLHCSVVAPGPNKLADIHCSIYSTKLPSVLPHSGKSLPWVRARARTICKPASLLSFRTGAYIGHTWLSHFCGHVPLRWTSITRFDSVFCCCFFFPVLVNDRYMKHMCKVNSNNSSWSFRGYDANRACTLAGISEGAEMFDFIGGSKQI